MEPDALRLALSSLRSARNLLAPLGVSDVERGFSNLKTLAESIGIAELAELLGPLERLLPRMPAPDMALNNLERLLTQPAAKPQLPGLLETRARGLETLLQLLSTSQFFSDTLVTNPDFLDVIRVDLRRNPSTAEMEQALETEINESFEDSATLRIFRRFRQRQLLRIGANDIIRDRPLEEITRDLSRVADVSLEIALRTAMRTMTQRFGTPMTSDDHPSRVVVLAFGKLGGEELNYSSDIDLMFIYDDEGMTKGRRSIENSEFYSRVVSEVVRLLASFTDRGQAYRVDLRLRPEGQRGALARSLSSTLAYYDLYGRTWERQALIKIRPVAGDRALGSEFLKAIEPFVYRRYLSFAEINEIKAMKRRIEQKAVQAGISDTDVKTGRGGIRDIEFTIQFLQLLNGGDLQEVRQRSTLAALEALETAGCLTDLEYRNLEDSYRFLRKTEHRLQLLFDWQTHQLPDSTEELAKLARRMGYAPQRSQRPEDRPEIPPSDIPDGSFAQKRSPLDETVEPLRLDTRDLLHEPLDQFLHDYHEKTRLNRTILDFLLHSAFQGDSQAEPESDLILSPEPDESTIRNVLGRYPFRDVMGAYQNLTQLAQESVPFLSTRRCRHFLASIAPPLLRAVAETPDPDLALVHLEKVTASLGAKAILWELFSFNPPTLKLYVDLCAGSPFLSEILINNPGMIDEVLDSLVLNQPRSITELNQELVELCRGAADLEPILHSFQDKELLRIGVRDLLNKDDVRETTGALSDLAETILQQVVSIQEPALIRKLGQPILTDGPRAGQPARYAIIGLGKLGGREMSYHSDLDLIVIYEGDGRTEPPTELGRFDRFEPVDHFHFFTEFIQRLIRAMGSLGPQGRLYAIDMRLRPTGKEGSLAIPLEELVKYFRSGEGHLWERQVLTRARLICGDPEFGQTVLHAIDHAILLPNWSSQTIDEIRQMRDRMEASTSPRSLKRAKGGIVDIEFLVQMLQLKYGRQFPEIRVPNIWHALDTLLAHRLLDDAEHRTLWDAYSFLRKVESRLRIVTNRALSEYPESADDQTKLARRLGHASAEAFLTAMKEHAQATRDCFLRITDRERLTPAPNRESLA
ncbi:bifunctional [glutamate--ammonia ligase]-adenylyl-L-tyrosine phosphorylase/[glutamate--ammonia-ligase] adenylyltransferase [Tuwongella immobilis]|uniref:Uncharacterized protein n=1 Tax=Tuwongella immobilis TaxID=692036 RepID=A0A6C2YTY7_9BACT|nr:bifunctional [glutamate--ammonia ligase]-adenylyl-L-tyrosine phosphorylase/[glutamate--ammonia-ligase] adenylyltransferase [Tuwongella immobilis]VIP04894.1 (glutamate--ammonia-ligase) adenylyltransferase : Glutamine synthetase adenylyltransferase OS=Singulisphaera acidiphila (strain ATCC BAA-1392 / DSM 18658 / VKM B-2454 / MOB10) GN=Sinac_5955 PE=4 SV=1: GlnE: GlnD_UR_UTase: GlnE: GlnD_UR_UTase [Tuwongella immobilis]VTS07147.1 (glutamate--ammonia-ligase) adenylyltransferase : Glutamine synthet